MHPVFETEVSEMNKEVMHRMFAAAKLLMKDGPHLGRPYVDTLKASAHTNMKELRFDVNNGVWRVAFAFDPERKAVLLIAGDKSGKSQKTFYKKLIRRPISALLNG